VPKETFINLNEEKQEKVMRSAIDEFSNHGFEKANIGTIAKNAGVSKGSMYQYFENKKELFLFSVEWSVQILMTKFGKEITADKKEINIFDYMLSNAREMWIQMHEEREVVIFVQDVFLGKYSKLTDESMGYMMKISDEVMLNFVINGKKNGYIRKDIDNTILCLYMTGVSFKIKEHIMRKSRESGGDMIDDAFDTVEKDINAMVELMRNGLKA